MTRISRRLALAGTAAALLSAATRTASAATDPLADLINAAKAEGSVIVDGPPYDAVRKAFTADFQKTYGIPVSYISSGSSKSAARVRAERAAGKYLLDVFVSGPDTPIFSFLPAGWLDKVEPILVAPDVVDTRKWKDNHLWYADPGNTILRVQQFVAPELAINTKYVQPRDMSTWTALLDPKWRGRIAAKDPTITGAGASLDSFFYIELGPDFVKRLYVDQKPVLTRDQRQAAQWLAEGTYPILVGADLSELITFQKAGYPVEPVFPHDAPSVLTGGFGDICLVNKAPHPNAAKLFINWLAGPAGQLAYAEATEAVSLRTDLKYTGIPAYMFPQKGKNYLDTYSWDFVTQQRDAAFAKVQKLLNE